MLQQFERANVVDDQGNPAGGYCRLDTPWPTDLADVAHEPAIYVRWQDGPLGRGEARKEPNGAFVETLIAMAKQRIEFYQTAQGGRFACYENDAAITHLALALEVLEERTAQREARNVEGTHEA